MVGSNSRASPAGLEFVFEPIRHISLTKLPLCQLDLVNEALVSRSTDHLRRIGFLGVAQ